MRLSLLLILPILASCTPLTSAPGQPQSNAISQISPAQKLLIGRKIWQNECGGTINGLTTWNAGEEFPSMGIGHFIWYPANFNGRWSESFPQFIAFARASGRRDIPGWLLTTPDCPWNNKAQFQSDFNGPHLSSLRAFLANSVDLQTDFIIARSRSALPAILAAAPAAQRNHINANYHKVATTPQGIYALIDYVNFKGDGINASESYNGQGWGLLQVLQNMRPCQAGPDAARAFAESAKFVLRRRVNNAPPARGESRWTPGWENRCDTYARPL